MPHTSGEAARDAALPGWRPAGVPRRQPLRHDAAAVSKRQAGLGSGDVGGTRKEGGISGGTFGMYFTSHSVVSVGDDDYITFCRVG